jgi:hypothetical protein
MCKLFYVRHIHVYVVLRETYNVYVVLRETYTGVCCFT